MTNMLDGNSNKFALEMYKETFENVSKHIVHSFRQFVENELIEYVRKDDGKLWVISEEKQIKPEEFIRNVLIGKKYLRNRSNKSTFGIKHFEFHPEVGELDEKENDIIGNHDIKVTGISLGIIGEADEDIYFSFECKRLNNHLQNTSEYINNGIKRYVKKQYSSKMPIAGMMGFIEEKTPEFFVNQIKRKLSKLNDNKIIITKQTLKTYDIYPDFKNLYNSIHNKIDNSEIQIYHFMFSIENIITIIEE
jgi:hypothetical protein